MTLDQQQAYRSIWADLRGVSFSQGWIDAKGINTRYLHSGSKDKPTLILLHTPVFAQIIFFGAVLSAIMSCSSATLLAPSVAFSENIIKEIFPHMSDRTFLRTMRTVLVCFAGVVLVFALNSQASIFKMVENAYKVTLARVELERALRQAWA